MDNTVRQRIIMIGPHPDGRGGISRVVKLLMSSHLFMDHDIMYIETIDDTHNKYIVLIRSLFLFLKLCVRNNRLVYIHTASRNSFYRKSIFMCISLLLGKKVVLHIHPSYFTQFISDMKGLKRTFLYALLERVERFIVLSDGMREELSTIFPNNRISVIPNPVSIEEIQNEGCDVSSREDNLILYLGWYNRSKGVYDLVDAVALLLNNGVNLTAEFHGTKEIEQLRSYVESKGLEKHIHIYGWADEKKKVRLLKTSTMLVLPSHSEGVPNVILEAMAARTPIVSTHVGGLRTILRNGDNAIIAEPCNPEDLSEKIMTCLRNPELRIKISERAYGQAQNEYDLPIIAERLSEILDQSY